MARHATRTAPGSETQTREAASDASPDPASSVPATIIATDASDGSHANELTIIGRGTPSSFEITVDGTIEPAGEDAADPAVVSGTTVEGTIETGTIRFGFDGDLADVTLVDRTITGSTPGAVPNVHVDYGAE